MMDAGARPSPYGLTAPSTAARKAAEKKRTQELVASAGHRTGLTERLLVLFRARPLPPLSKGPRGPGPKRPPALPRTGLARLVARLGEGGAEGSDGGEGAASGETERPPFAESAAAVPARRTFRSPEMEQQARIGVATRPEHAAAKLLAAKAAREAAAARERPSWDPHASDAGSKTADPYRTLFLANLSDEVTDRKLLRELEAFGPVARLRMVTRGEGGLPAGYAFAEFESDNDFREAYRRLDGKRVGGRRLKVDAERARTIPDWLPRRLRPASESAAAVGGLAGAIPALVDSDPAAGRPPPRPLAPPPKNPKKALERKFLERAVEFLRDGGRAGPAAEGGEAARDGPARDAARDPAQPRGDDLRVRRAEEHPRGYDEGGRHRGHESSPAPRRGGGRYEGSPPRQRQPDRQEEGSARQRYGNGRYGDRRDERYDDRRDERRDDRRDNRRDERRDDRRDERRDDRRDNRRDEWHDDRRDERYEGGARNERRPAEDRDEMRRGADEGRAARYGREGRDDNASAQSPRGEPGRLADVREPTAPPVASPASTEDGEIVEEGEVVEEPGRTKRAALPEQEPDAKRARQALAE